MSQNWETTFAIWGASPGPTEQAKADNAERAVRKAIDASTKLSSKPIEVFVQGSYANRTNVREDSDVDVCVLYTGAFFPDYSLSEGLTSEALGYGDGTYPYSEFKNDVEAALVSYFGRREVVRGQKAFDVHANTYRTDADVVPCFEHRRILGSVQSHWQQSGTELHPDNGGVIVNWPQQNYDNGVQKNTATSRRFKAIVRILKRLRNQMHDEGHTAADPIPSFLSECLVWNVPNEGFGHSTLGADVRYALAHLWNNTRTDEACNEWGEINEKKYLFRGHAPASEYVFAGGVGLRRLRVMTTQRYTKAIIYTAVVAWTVVLYLNHEAIKSPWLHHLSTVITVVLYAVIAFDLWLWKLPFLHDWFVKRPVIDGTWKVELRSNWKDPAAAGATVPPIEGYMVVRQTFSTLSMRLLTADSHSELVGTEIVCSADRQYCVSGVYRNEPRFEARPKSEIHYGAVWLRIITDPVRQLVGHYWTDRSTAGEMQLNNRQPKRFQTFDSAKLHYQRLPKSVGA